MNRETLIPTFQPGDLVRVVPRPNPEFACARCERMFGRWLEEQVALVVRPTGGFSGAACAVCDEPFTAPEGTYAVWSPKTGFFGVPWNWIEPIDTEGE